MKFLAVLILLSGCAPLSHKPQDQYRYTLTAYDHAGKIIGQARFGEAIRDGKIIVSDDFTDYRLRIDPNIGLDIVEHGAAHAHPTTRTSLPPYRLGGSDFARLAYDIDVKARFVSHDGDWIEGDVTVPEGWWLVSPIDHQGATTQPLTPQKRSPWGENGKLRN